MLNPRQLLEWTQAPPPAAPLREDPELSAVLAARGLREGTAETPSGQYDFEFGRPYNTALRHLSGSEYELRELSYEERVEIWRRVHQAWERNPWAKGGLRTIRNFTVGVGHTITCRAAAVREALERFRADPENAVEEYDKAFCEQLLLDGDLFVRFTEVPATGRVVIDPLPPWWVTDIEMDPDFRRRVVAYRVRFRRQARLTGDGGVSETEEWVPARQILHVAINRLGYEVRGRSELFAILPWLKAYKDWLEERARVNRFKGGLYYVVNLEGATPAQVASKRSQYRTPPPPGSIVVATAHEKWTTVDPKIGADDVSEDGRQLKLASAVGLGLPEYMLSDGENANRATANAQQLPALRNFEDYQDLLAHLVWQPIYRRVIELAIGAGLVREEEPEMDPDGDPVLDGAGRPRVVRALQAFEVAFPQLAEGDPKNLAEALNVHKANRWVSDETAMRALGYDPALEQKKLEAEEGVEAARVAAGLAIGAVPPGAPPLPEHADEDEEV